MSLPAGARSDELAANLRDVRARIAGACAAAGRSADSVRLLAVTKTWPASDVRALAALGVTDMGENRHREAAEKAALTGDLALRWHFIGQLQSNKARAVAAYASVVHSVDRERLVAPLAAGANDAGRIVEVFVQLSLDGDGDRGGAAEREVAGLADLVAATDGLRLAGLMAVAPVDGDAAQAYQRLAEAAARVRADHPGAVDISAGMSGDLDAAIAAGSTLVRVGTALLGSRPPIVR